MTNIKKGEDKEVLLTVTSEGVAFDITDYNAVVVVYSNEISVVGRFATTSGFVDSVGNTYEDITVVDASAGEISFELTSAMTSKAKIGFLYAVVKLRHATDDFYLEADPVKLGTIVATPATNVIGF
jgi:hypothetical protein